MSLFCCDFCDSFLCSIALLLLSGSLPYVFTNYTFLCNLGMCNFSRLHSASSEFRKCAACQSPVCPMKLDNVDTGMYLGIRNYVTQDYT